MQYKLLPESFHKQEITREYLSAFGFTESIPERYWSKVVKTDGCWSWTGQRTDKGYGRLGAGPRAGAAIGAHRISWILNYGPIPEGMCVLHHCDTPPCTRPDHLWLGTTPDNNQDQFEKGRRAISRQLTPQQVSEIKRLYASGQHTQKQIGAMFGIHQTGVGKMIRGETWQNPYAGTFRVPKVEYVPTFQKRVKARPEVVEQMKQAYANGNHTYESISKQFGISIGYVWQLLNHRY